MTVRGAVSLAGVVDLKEADRLGLGSDATARFLGGHWEQQEERYRCSSPMDLLPIGVPQVLVHGTNDTVVPPSMSEITKSKQRSTETLPATSLSTASVTER